MGSVMTMTAFVMTVMSAVTMLAMFPFTASEVMMFASP